MRLEYLNQSQHTVAAAAAAAMYLHRDEHWKENAFSFDWTGLVKTAEWGPVSTIYSSEFLLFTHHFFCLIWCEMKSREKKMR